MTALKKQMDIFGIATLGLITAVGGGVIRDLVLGNTPPETFKNPIYGIVAIITSMIVFLPVFRNAVSLATYFAVFQNEGFLARMSEKMRI